MKLILNAHGNDVDFADHCSMDLSKKDIQTLLAYMDKMLELSEFDNNIISFKALWFDINIWDDEEETTKIDDSYRETYVSVCDSYVTFVTHHKYSDMSIISESISRNSLKMLEESTEDIVDLRKND